MLHVYTHTSGTQLTRYRDNGRDDLVSRLPDKSVGMTERCEHQSNEVRGEMWLKGSATVLYNKLQSSGGGDERDNLC